MEFIDDKNVIIRGFVALLIPIIFYWRVLSIVLNEALFDDSTSHILAVPFLIGYIVYTKRDTLRALVNFESKNIVKIYGFPINELIGVMLCALAYVIKWFGSYTFNSLEINMISFPLFVSGVILLVFNYDTLRFLMFPIAFLAFLIPPPFVYLQLVGSALSTFSSMAAFTILKILRVPVSLIIEYGGPIILLTLPSGLEVPFAIDIACSGLYSLIGFTLFAVFASYIAKGSFKKKIAVLALGFPLIYSLNIFRIILILVIGYLIGPSTALNVFHMFGGWVLIFIGTLLLLLISERLFNIGFFRKKTENCLHRTDGENSLYCLDCGKILEEPQSRLERRDIVKYLLILGLSIILVFNQIPVFTLTKGYAEALVMTPGGAQQSVDFLPEVSGYRQRFVMRDTRFENITGQDASLKYAYIPEDGSQPYVWILIEIGETKGILHPWEVCLISWPMAHGGVPQAVQIDKEDIHLIDNPPLSGRYFTYLDNETNLTNVVLYWYTRSTFQTNSGFEQKFVKISVIEILSDSAEYQSAKQEILPFAMAIVEYWKPITAWSWAPLLIAENGQSLIFFIELAISFIIVYALYLKKQDKNFKESLYSRISIPRERLVLESVKKLKPFSVESRILSNYKERTGEEIDSKELHRILREAEAVGLLEKKIVNVDDDPHISWNATF